MSDQFRGGPLEDGRRSQVHSLRVHINGDGMHSAGSYIRAYADEAKTIPLDYFLWYGELVTCEACEGGGFFDDEPDRPDCAVCNGTGSVRVP